MKSIDDGLSAANATASARSRSKMDGKSGDYGAANQRAAFENAFADAGKKKEPAISIRAKASVEITPQVRLQAKSPPETTAKIGTDLVIPDPEVDDTVVDDPMVAKVKTGDKPVDPEADVDKDRKTSLPKLVPDSDTKPSLPGDRESNTPAELDADSVLISTFMEADVEPDVIGERPKEIPEGQRATKSDEKNTRLPNVDVHAAKTTTVDIKAIETAVDVQHFEAVVVAIEPVKKNMTRPVPGDAKTVVSPAVAEKQQNPKLMIPTPQTAKTTAGPLDDAVTGVVEDSQALLAGHSTTKTEKAGDVQKTRSASSSVEPIKMTKKTEEPETTEVATDVPDGVPASDVSQLLAMLSPVEVPAPANAQLAAEPTPAMSEFQALAQRAGDARISAKDTKAETRIETASQAVDDAPRSGSDQVFRFARADGKGQSVSMNVASDSDKMAAKVETTATNAKAETVTVLEARRYLGLAPTSNAGAVTSQIAGNPEWARALQPSDATTSLTQGATGKVLNTLKIQMHPIDLGTVTATLRLKDDELHVEIKVETGEAFRQLSEDQNAMVKALRAQGFAVDQVNIVFNAADSSGSSTQQQSQSQAGQQGREASTDGQAQGRGQNNDKSSQGRGGERWTGNDTTGDASAHGLDRAGDVYM